ncbi:MAG: hypothetical protein RSC58_06900 [Ruthenibacterium sp.]
MHKYLLLDKGILVGFNLTNAQIEVNPIQKDTENNPLFTEEFFAADAKKWEVRYDNGYPNVIYDEIYHVYRCYYTLFTLDECSEQTPIERRGTDEYKPHGRIASLCYAQSDDGIHFVKPNLGLVEFNGNKNNNILMRYAHGTGVFLDKEEQNPKKRYKLVTKVEYCAARHYMATAFSEDGIHFSNLMEWPEFNPAGDTHNFPMRDDKTGKFAVITRIWKDGVRICAKCESDNFINWSQPVEIMRGSGFEQQVYSMPVFRYENLYLGLASIYHEGDTDDANYDTVDVALAYSTKLEYFDRVTTQQYVIERDNAPYRQGTFDCGCIYAAAPIEMDGKLWVYYMGGNGKHTGFRETSFARGYWEKDKFAGYVAKNSAKSAKLVTSHFCLYGDNLYILADIAQGGSLSVALGTKQGKIYEGFEAENCILEQQNDGYYQVRFQNKKLTDLPHTVPVSLHITFSNAKVYAVKGDFENHLLKY